MIKWNLLFKTGEKQTVKSEIDKPLAGMRLLVCGKGGSALETCPAMNDVRGIADHLETAIHQHRVVIGATL